MSNDVFNTVRDCTSCAKALVTLTKAQKQLRLFPTNGTFEFVTVDILGPLSRKNSRKRFIVVIKYRCLKLTRAININDTTAPLVVLCVLEIWVFPYNIPNSILRDNGRQFIA